MTGLFDIALSGLTAAGHQLATTAHNIANLDTQGYKSRTANLTPGPDGRGVDIVSFSTNNLPGPIDADGTEGSNVDLATEAVNLTKAKNLYTANAMVVKVGYQMTGTLLDMFDRDYGARSKR